MYSLSRCPGVGLTFVGCIKYANSGIWAVRLCEQGRAARLVRVNTCALGSHALALYFRQRICGNSLPNFPTCTELCKLLRTYKKVTYRHVFCCIPSLNKFLLFA